MDRLHNRSLPYANILSPVFMRRSRPRLVTPQPSGGTQN